MNKLKALKIKLFGYSKKQRALMVLDHSIYEWMKVAGKGWGRISAPHNHLFVYEELKSARDRIASIL